MGEEGNRLVRAGNVFVMMDDDTLQCADTIRDEEEGYYEI